MLAHREEAPQGAPKGTVLCVHGYPESSYMWRHLLAGAAQAGWRAVAPDLAGFGDSPPDPPGTWERHVAALDAFHRALDLGPCVLVLHDWGGLIGLRWALDRPEVCRAVVIADSGFFPDGQWHGLAEAMRTHGAGEELIGSLTRDGFTGMLRAVSPAFDDEALAEYWRAFATPEHRRGHLELYRSGDFAKLEPYDLGALRVPALVLWGADDVFAPVGGAHRFAKELPDARLEVLEGLEGLGHFVFDEAPERTTASVLRFLGELELLVP
jgi:haloalkane dehalogenase